jgi:formamidopyrimidine-DNA glycosylase
MPELPDVEVYVEAVARRFAGRALVRLRPLHVFVVRSVDPPVAALAGRRLEGTRRLGKRIVLAFDGGLFAIIHLMIAGRLRVLAADAKPPGRIALAAFEFDSGESLLLTEAGTKRRASIHLVAGDAALAAHDPGGLEPVGATLAAFRAALSRDNHTVKRALTDPHIIAGIGNSYSDEILHRARLSPMLRTAQMADDAWARLHAATQSVLAEWTERLRAEALDEPGGFPQKVTAFRKGMAVHGRHGEPCPVCAAPVQRIVHGERELNYCPGCQTGGRILKDRALSRLLHDDWPATLADL